MDPDREEDKEGVGSGVSCRFKAILIEEEMINAFRGALDKEIFTYYELSGFLYQGRPDSNTQEDSRLMIRTA